MGETIPVTSEIRAAVRDYADNKLHNTAYLDSKLITLYWLNENCRKPQDGGEQLQSSFIESTYTTEGGNSKRTELITGLETIDTSVIDEFDKFQYDWNFTATPVIAKLKDTKLHMGGAPEKIFDYWAAKVDSGESRARQDTAYDMWTNTTDSTGKLRGFAMGIRDYRAGSGITTYGGQTIAADDGVLDPKEDATVTTLSLGAMEDLWMKLEQKTDVVITGATLYAKYWGLLQPQQRFTDTELAKAGFKNLMFNTAPVTFDSSLSTSTTIKMAYLAAGDERNKYIEYFVDPGLDFQYENIADDTPTQAITIGRYYHACQLMFPGRRWQGCFTALTG